MIILIYINDLKFSVKNSKTHHFADDTNFLYINKSLKIVCKKVNQDLKGVTDWLNSNRISLNISKTEFVIFCRPRNQTFILESPYKRTHKKLNKSNSMLSKICHYVYKNTIRSLYFTLFSSYIGYVVRFGVKLEIIT